MTLKQLFRLPTSGSKLDAFSKPQNPPKIAQKAPKTVPQTLPKRIQNSISYYNAPKSKKMQPFHTKTSFLTFPDPRKSSQNRCQNALKISFILDTFLEPQKIRFLMLKRRQNGPPKFPIFFKNRPKIADNIAFCARCLLKASKSLSRAVPEPSRDPPEPSRASL